MDLAWWLHRGAHQRLADGRARPRWRERLAPVGCAHSLVEVTVRDEQGREQAAGEGGKVCVRGPVAMNGCWNDPAASTGALQDGWLHTGDTGHFTADGALTLPGRSKDLVVGAGSNIDPREVEEPRSPTAAWPR